MEMPVGDIVDVLVVGDASVPGLGKDGFVDGLVDSEALEGGAYAHESRAAVSLGVVYPRTVLPEVTLYSGHAAEVAEVAPDVFLAVEFLSALPYLSMVAEIVEDDHPALRHGGEVCLDILVGPVALVGIEEPAHLEPDGVGVDRSHGVVYALRYLGEGLGIPERCVHFVEGIDAVDVVCAVHLGLLFHEVFLDLRIERVHRT